MKKASGSEKLLKQSFFDKKQMAQLIDIGDRYGRILDWCWFGQPGIDGFCGTVRVDKGQAANIVKELLALDDVRINLKVFPEGQPDPTDVLIDIGTRRFSR